MPAERTANANSTVERANGSRATYSAGIETADKVLVTAERLFAQQGFDAVTLREIGRHAGQRNTNVVTYYFESKIGVVAAILQFRLPTYSQRQLELLGQVMPGQGHDTYLGYARALVLPVVDSMEQGTWWPGFLAQLQMNRKMRVAMVDRVGPFMAAHSGLEHTMRRELWAHLTRPERRLRFDAILTMIVHTVAARQTDLAAGDAGGLTTRSFQSQLIEIVAGSLGSQT